ncbi:TetR/AcrR family transcriptional regulator [Flavobacterium sp.]|uniref:TetR/AcrR family transcriptional regulator n=1 Tax=Flavobacterium sp. TaxID=239 RepID=UPI003D6AA811
MNKGDKTKQFIIEKAAPIFNTKGIAATSMSDLMEATKLSKGSLYVHFENKNVLVNSAVDHNMQLLITKVNASLSKHSIAKDKLFAFIDIFEDPLKPLVSGGCPMLNFGTESDDTDDVVKMKVSKMVDFTQKTIAEIIESGIKQGAFKPEWDYNEFATALFAMIEGGILISRVNGNNSKMEVISKYLKKIIEEHSL